MTRQELTDKLARAIAENEGFFVTEAQAKARKLRYPTCAQSNANPGNIRTWRDAKGQPYPRGGGYVDLVAWPRTVSPAWHASMVITRAGSLRPWRRCFVCTRPSPIGMTRQATLTSWPIGWVCVQTNDSRIL